LLEILSFSGLKEGIGGVGGVGIFFSFGLFMELKLGSCIEGFIVGMGCEFCG
jgi:hypothetical protein